MVPGGIFFAEVNDAAALSCGTITDIPLTGVPVDEPGGFVFSPSLGKFLWNGFFTLHTVTDTGVSAFVGLIDGRYKGLAFVGDVLYSITSVSFGPDPLLRVIDPTTGATVSSIPITLGGSLIKGGTGLATDPLDGKLWAILLPGRVLATIDPVSGIATKINTLGTGFAGLAFLPDGTLLGVTGDGGSPAETLFILSKTPGGTPTLLCPLGNGDDGEAIAFNPVDGLLYHASGISSGLIFETIDLGIVITPPSPLELTELLIEEIDTTVEENHGGKKLKKGLEKVIKKLDKEKFDKACKKVDRFTKQVEKFIKKDRLDKTLGESFIESAEAIKVAIGC